MAELFYTDAITEGDKPDELRMFEHGFVRLDASMADDLSVVNSARVSFAVRREEMEERDKGLIRFLMRDRHGSPFEHNAFRFHVRTPIFVAREWFRHRVGCLTGDTVVTFVDTNGVASAKISKTLDELWQMWSQGERNGHALAPEQRAEVARLDAEGRSARSIARTLGIGRRAVTACLHRGSNEWRNARSRLRKMRLRVLNEDTLEFEVGHLSEVFNSGVKPVYKVSLADGKELSMTAEHRVLTQDGWQTLRDAVGLEGEGTQARATRTSSMMVNGRAVYKDYEWMRERRRRRLSVQEIADEAGCSYHTIRKWLAVHDLRFTRYDLRGRRPWNKDVKGYRINRTFTQADKAVLRAARSGPNSNFWRGGISSGRALIGRWTTDQAPKVHAHFDYTCQECMTRGGKLHAHHIVPVWLDESRAMDVTNLITLCDSCHRQVHRTQASELDFARRFASHGDYPSTLQEVPQRKGCKMIAHPVKIVAVEYVGMKQTYDLAVEGPWHNFVANGMVVHNSFNEESARYHKLGSDFYIPSKTAVRSQVGKPGSYSFEPVDEELAEETIARFERIYKDLYAEYEDMLARGVAKELARTILPFGVFTQFYWTLNARSLMNFLSLRNAPNAQYEIRVYAEAVERLFAQKMPITHECFVEFGRRSP